MYIIIIIIIIYVYIFKSLQSFLVATAILEGCKDLTVFWSKSGSEHALKSPPKIIRGVVLVLYCISLKL